MSVDEFEVEKQRKKLGQTLAALLGSDNVYFQPPENLKMSYPCFVYSLEDTNVIYADNSPYILSISYQITYISKTPDIKIIPELILKLTGSRHNRSYPSDNLNHHVFYYNTMTFLQNEEALNG